MASVSGQEDSNTTHEDSTISFDAKSLPIEDASNIPLQLTSFNAAPIETSINNSTSNTPSTPKRTRRELSPMRTRSKSRRLNE